MALSSGLMSLGALILETSINNSLSKEIDVHAEKKSKISYKCSDDIWMKLAEYVVLQILFNLSIIHILIFYKGYTKTWVN